MPEPRFFTIDRRIDRGGATIFYQETQAERPGMHPVDFAIWVIGSNMSYEQQVVAVLAYCVALGVSPVHALRVLDEHHLTKRRTLGVMDLPPSGLTPLAFARRLDRKRLTYDQLIAAVLAYCLGLQKSPEKAFDELDQPQPSPDPVEEVSDPVDPDEVQKEDDGFSLGF